MCQFTCKNLDRKTSVINRHVITHRDNRLTRNIAFNSPEFAISLSDLQETREK